MKNTKRRTALIVVLVIVLAALIFLGYVFLTPNVVNLTRWAARNLEKASSAKAEVSIDYEGKVSYSVFNTPVTVPVAVQADFDASVAKEPAVIHMDNGTIKGTAMEEISLDVPFESYVRQEDGRRVTYLSMNHGAWTKTKAKAKSEDTSSETEAKQEIDMKTVIGLLQRIKNGEIKAERAEKTEMVCDREAYRLDIFVSGAVLQELLKAAPASGEGGSAVPEGLDLSNADTKAVLYIYKKEKLPAKISIDCAAIGNAVMQTATQDKSFEGTAEKFTVEAVFTEYNTLGSIEIPQEVTQGAQETDRLPLLEGILSSIPLINSISSILPGILPQ